MIGNIHKVLVVMAIAALMVAQVAKSAATTSLAPAPAPADADLRAEGRILDTYVDDLVAFDKKCAELGKRPSITRAEFDSTDKQGEILKRRLAEVQSAVRRAIDKLKAAGQWETFDQIVLARISDSRFQASARAESLKKSLEQLAEGRNINVNEIGSPVDKLRNRVQARTLDSIFAPGKSTLASRAVRVAHTTGPMMFADSPRCMLARVRVAITRPFNGGAPSERANNAFNCYCMDFDCATT